MPAPIKGSLVGRGRTADVFDWEGGRVLKLFNTEMNPESCRREYAIAKAIHDQCGEGPAVFDFIELEGRPGIVYEKLEGHDMLATIFSQPWTLPSQVNTFADIHHRIRQNTAPEGLPDGKTLLRRDIGHADLLEDSVKERLYILLAGLPDDDKLCHMDYHPGNIQLTHRGPAVMDWLTACRGAPAMDIARTAMMLEGADLPDAGGLKQALARMVQGTTYSRYLKRTLALTGIPRWEVDAWMLPVMGARLAENIPGSERPRLLVRIQSTLPDTLEVL